MIALLLATLIIAFLAGMVALAMPCCFTVLLPAYVAKSFGTLGSRLGMTAVFGAGIATVLLPIAMGVTLVTTFLVVNHPLFFVIGGFFMILLGLVTLWGTSFIPMMSIGVDLNRKDVPSVYALGVFSGVASSCCAPVLAGVLVLAVLSGSWLPALLVGLAYVAGMVFPLLLVAIAWDRNAVRVPEFFRGRMVSIRWLGGTVSIHSSKLIAGVLFISMGAVTIALGLMDRMISVPGSDLFGIWQTTLERALMASFSNPIVAVLVVMAILAMLAGVLLYLRRHPRSRDDLPDAPGGSTPPVESEAPLTPEELERFGGINDDTGACPEGPVPDRKAVE